MEKIDLSTNSKAIEAAYEKVVKGDPSTTYVVYTVTKSAAVEVEETGDGDLNEFIEHFRDGVVQFGLARVSIEGSEVHKIILLGWCPDNSPAKLRMSFGSNFAEVAKVLRGYHVQITARDQDDLDAKEFEHRVGAAAGARYSLNTSSTYQRATPAVAKPVVAKPKPAVAPIGKVSFVPRSTGKPIGSSASASDPPKPFGAPKYTPGAVNSTNSQSQNGKDEWGGEKELEERDFNERPLEDVPSAYKPTKVNIDELRKQKSDTISSTPKARLEQEKTEEPEPVAFSERMKALEANKEPESSGRLTSLPKPKVSNTVTSRFPQAKAATSAPTFGAKPKIGGVGSKPEVGGGASRDFASLGGKTPSQLWAEKRGLYKTVESSDEPVKSATDGVENISIKALEPAKEVETPKSAAPVATPTRNLPPPPVRQAIPEPEEVEEEEEEEEVEEEEIRAPVPAAAPSLPTRNLPPPPVRQAEPEPEPEQPEPEQPEPEQSEPESQPEASDKPSAIAEYDNETNEDDELAFKEGDLIVDIEFVHDEWWQGKHGVSGAIGIFPALYVKLEGAEEAETAPEESAAAAAGAAAGLTGVAEYEFERTEDNELEFAVGDEIVDIEYLDNDWYSGRNLRTGEEGVFPGNFLAFNK